MKRNIDLTENRDFRTKEKREIVTNNNVIRRLRNSYIKRFNAFNLRGYGEKDFMFFANRTLVKKSKAFRTIGDMLPISKLVVKSVLERLNTNTCVTDSNDPFMSGFTSTSINAHDYGGYINNEYLLSNQTRQTNSRMYKYDPSKNFCIRCGAEAPINYPWSKKFVELCLGCQEDMHKEFNDVEFIIPKKGKVRALSFNQL